MSPVRESPPVVARTVPVQARADRWRPGSAGWTGLAAVAIAAIVADQVTKSAISSSLSLGESVDVAPTLSLWHVRNDGIAFGIFTRRLPIVVGLTALALIWMLAYFARSGARHRLTPVAIGLLLGGSVSNLIDRIRNGYVTDFIYLHWFSAFNAADSFIVVGVGLLLYSLFRGDEREGEALFELPRPR
jgi:signal peptidase II